MHVSQETETCLMCEADRDLFSQQGDSKEKMSYVAVCSASVVRQEAYQSISIHQTSETYRYLHHLLGCISPPYTFFLLNDDMELNRNRQLFV